MAHIYLLVIELFKDLKVSRFTLILTILVQSDIILFLATVSMISCGGTEGLGQGIVQDHSLCHIYHATLDDSDFTAVCVVKIKFTFMFA